MTIPRVLTAEPPVVAGNAIKTDGSRGAATILLVDDDAGVRGFAHATLARSGYHVVDCSTAEEALRWESEYAGPIDLVLSDINMPGLTGIELVQLLRARRPDVKVVLMSGCLPEHVSRTAGAQHPFMAKPFLPSSLLLRVREVLGEQNRRCPV